MSLYNELGVSMKASQEIIKQKYCSKMQYYRSMKDEKAVYNLNMAYKILKSEDRRSIYNIFGDQVIEMLTGSKYQYGFLKIIDPLNLYLVSCLLTTFFVIYIISILLTKEVLQYNIIISTAILLVSMTALLIRAYFAIYKISSELPILKKIKFFFLLLMSDSICLVLITLFNKRSNFLTVLPLISVLNVVWLSEILLVYSASEGAMMNPSPLIIMLVIKGILYLSLFIESYFLTSCLFFSIPS